MIRTCVVIGSGNVATHLAKALSRHIEILQVYSRDISHASALATAISPSCEAVDDVNAIDRTADLYVMSVSDDSIRPLIEATEDSGHAIWAHTSGSVDIDVFKELRVRYGVLYPLQTFSKSKPVDMAKVPFYIEANDAAAERELMELASLIGGKVTRLNSEGRRRLHIAAVFACNFVNYMWVVADRQLRMCGTDIHALDPLLKETVGKIASLSPADAQTGPARRGDTRVIQSHLNQLEGADAELYEMISRHIMDTYK